MLEYHRIAIWIAEPSCDLVEKKTNLCENAIHFGLAFCERTRQIVKKFNFHFKLLYASKIRKQKWIGNTMCVAVELLHAWLFNTVN